MWLLLPLLIALGLLAYISYLAAGHPSGAQLWSIIHQTWLLVVILIVPYLAARLLAWSALLDQLGIVVPWRQLTASFAAGESTKSLPAGVSLQHYAVSRLRHLGQHSVVRSTMATTAMPGVAPLIGLPGVPWVRWALLGIGARLERRAHERWAHAWRPAGAVALANWAVISTRRRP